MKLYNSRVLKSLLEVSKMSSSIPKLIFLRILKTPLNKNYATISL